MKRLLTVLLIICTLIIFTACNTIEGIKKDLHLSKDEKTENTDGKNTNDDNQNGNNADDDEATKTKADEWRETYECITVKDAIAICASTGNTETEDSYYIIVEIVEITDDFYGNMTVKDSTGQITVYGSYDANGEKKYGELGTTVPKVGDTVLFCTNLINYGNIQPEMRNSRIIDFYTPGIENSGNTGTGSGDSGSNDTGNDSGNAGTGSGDSGSGNTGNNSGNTGTGSGDSGSGNTGNDSGNTGNGTVTVTKEDTWRETYECITISEALEICDQVGSNVTTERYYIIGTIESLTNTTYGEMTIKDSTGSIFVYGTYTADGSDRYNTLSNKPVVGDVVLIYGTLKTHNNIREVASGWIIDFYTPGSTNSGNTGSGSGNSDSGNTGSGSTTTHTYNDFTSDEKSTMINILGVVLPFAPNDEYYVESYEDAVEFYTFDLTEADLSAYRLKLSSYIYTGSEVDEDYSDVIWHVYTKENLVVEVSLYYNEDDDYGTYSVLHVYAYLDTDPGNTSTGTGNGNTASGTLPEGVNGVYAVDFKQATNVKDVTDQGYYLDGCPTTGSPAVLVIPIEFSNQTAASEGYDIELIKDVFTKVDANDGFYSVYEYYFISSYEQLTLDITVLDNWFRPQYNSSYYENSTDSEGYANGDQLILDEALAYLATVMDLSKFDSDNNDIIDAVILVNTLDVGEDDFHWAYRYWNYHVDSDGYYYEYDGVSANDYVWASFQFIHESYDDEGSSVYDDTSVINTYTFIHEFAHVLGVDDYYNYNGDDHPMEGCDVMDIMFGDHNAYSKFNLGWITTSRLVVTDSSVTLTLEDFSKNGDTIIIANDWDEDLGAYQEYYVLMYYKGTGLNDIDAGYGYFSRDGIVVYHVNATLCTQVIDGETYYDVANNNNTPTQNGNGTEDNLIEYVKSSAGNFTYVEGDTLPTVTDDDGNTLAYTFTVVSLTADSATITFTAK